MMKIVKAMRRRDVESRRWLCVNGGKRGEKCCILVWIWGPPQ